MLNLYLKNIKVIDDYHANDITFEVNQNPYTPLNISTLNYTSRLRNPAKYMSTNFHTSLW